MIIIRILISITTHLGIYSKAGTARLPRTYFPTNKQRDRLITMKTPSDRALRGLLGLVVVCGVAFILFYYFGIVSPWLPNVDASSSSAHHHLPCSSSNHLPASSRTDDASSSNMPHDEALLRSSVKSEMTTATATMEIDFQSSIRNRYASPTLVHLINNSSRFEGAILIKRLASRSFDFEQRTDLWTLLPHNCHLPSPEKKNFLRYQLKKALLLVQQNQPQVYLSRKF